MFIFKDCEFPRQFHHCRRFLKAGIGRSLDWKGHVGEGEGGLGRDDSNAGGSGVHTGSTSKLLLDLQSLQSQHLHHDPWSHVFIISAARHFLTGPMFLSSTSLACSETVAPHNSIKTCVKPLFKVLQVQLICWPVTAQVLQWFKSPSELSYDPVFSDLSTTSCFPHLLNKIFLAVSWILLWGTSPTPNLELLHVHLWADSYITTWTFF